MRRIIYIKFLTADTRRQYIIFTWAIFSTSLKTGLPSQKHHAFQAKAFLRPSAFVCVRRANEVSGRLIAPGVLE